MRDAATASVPVLGGVTGQQTGQKLKNTALFLRQRSAPDGLRHEPPPPLSSFLVGSRDHEFAKAERQSGWPAPAADRRHSRFRGKASLAAPYEADIDEKRRKLPRVLLRRLTVSQPPRRSRESHGIGGGPAPQAVQLTAGSFQVPPKGQLNAADRNADNELQARLRALQDVFSETAWPAPGVRRSFVLSPRIEELAKPRKPHPEIIARLEADAAEAARPRRRRPNVIPALPDRFAANLNVGPAPGSAGGSSGSWSKPGNSDRPASSKEAPSLAESAGNEAPDPGMATPEPAEAEEAFAQSGGETLAGDSNDFGDNLSPSPGDEAQAETSACGADEAQEEFEEVEAPPDEEEAVAEPPQPAEPEEVPPPKVKKRRKKKKAPPEEEVLGIDQLVVPRPPDQETSSEEYESSEEGEEARQDGESRSYDDANAGEEEKESEPSDAYGSDAEEREDDGDDTFDQEDDRFEDADEDEYSDEGKAEEDDDYDSFEQTGMSMAKQRPKTLRTRSSYGSFEDDTGKSGDRGDTPTKVINPGSPAGGDGDFEYDDEEDDYDSQENGKKAPISPVSGHNESMSGGDYDDEFASDDGKETMGAGAKANNAANGGNISTGAGNGIGGGGISSGGENDGEGSVDDFYDDASTGGKEDPDEPAHKSRTSGEEENFEDDYEDDDDKEDDDSYGKDDDDFDD